MGEARRRKLLGIVPPARIERVDNPRFSAQLMGQVEDSYVVAKITDNLDKRIVTLQFHLYQIARKLYAEVFFLPIELDKYGWVGAHINDIWPLVCQLVVKFHYESIINVDTHKLEDAHKKI